MSILRHTLGHNQVNMEQSVPIMGTSPALRMKLEIKDGI